MKWKQGYALLHTSFAPKNCHKDTQKSNGPQSIAALKWAKGAKNA